MAEDICIKVLENSFFDYYLVTVVPTFIGII